MHLFLQYDVNFLGLAPFAIQFLAGLRLTTEISALALAMMIPLGLAGALLRTSQSYLFRVIVGAYVEVLRNVPLLVVLYILFYGLPGFGILLDPFVSGLAALTLNGTAYVVEIFRGGLAGIPQGQYDAGASLGLRAVKLFGVIILPQLLRISLPALGNQVVGTVLGSSLVSVVGVSELTNTSYVVGSVTYRWFEVFVVAGLMYYVAVKVINSAWTLVQKRWAAV